MKQDDKKRGVFEKVPGSGIWWIQYFDSQHRRRREKVGSRSAAIKLVEKRRIQTTVASSANVAKGSVGLLEGNL